MIEKDHIRSELAKFGQEHLLNFYDDLTEDQQCSLLKDIQRLNLAEVCGSFDRTQSQNGSLHETIDDLLEPLSSDIHQSLARTSADQLKRFRDIGNTSPLIYSIKLN